MSDSHSPVLAAVLYWGMLLGGTATLVPCVVLPPWLEYQAQLRRRAAVQARLDTVENRIADMQKQIDHIENDPAYLFHLAEQEFGETYGQPDVETIPIATSTQPVIAEDDAEPEEESDPLPQLASFVEQTLREYPYTRLFASPNARPPLMAMGGGLILGAIVLLGNPHARRRAAADEDT